MKRVIVDDHGYPLISVDQDHPRRWQAHPYEPDDAGWVSAADLKAFVGFIIAIGLFIAITAVSGQ